MMALLQNFAVPILYIASAIVFILGLKLICKVRSARRGTAMLGLGFVLALLGVAIEAAHLDPKLPLLGLAIGTLLGLLVGLGVRTDPGAGVGPLLAASGGVAAAPEREWRRRPEPFRRTDQATAVRLYGAGPQEARPAARGHGKRCRGDRCRDRQRSA